jgi:pimeloyl-ACP methyl ester carboxylesterase
MIRNHVFTRRTLLIASAAGATTFTKADTCLAQERVPPRTYVLIHGGWYGGWVWRDVVPELRGLGHAVSAPTMTGVGERKHLISDSVGLTTNVDDIVHHIEMEGLRDIHLVGWSYGGMVATGVLARMPNRVRSVIYLDAFVPENGKALADYAAPPVRERFLKAAAEKQQYFSDSIRCVRSQRCEGNRVLHASTCSATLAHSHGAG